MVIMYFDDMKMYMITSIKNVNKDYNTFFLGRKASYCFSSDRSSTVHKMLSEDVLFAL